LRYWGIPQYPFANRTDGAASSRFAGRPLGGVRVRLASRWALLTGRRFAVSANDTPAPRCGVELIFMFSESQLPYYCRTGLLEGH
jgi:hypothetical protein